MGLKDEVGVGGRCRGEPHAVGEYEQTAIQTLVQLDATAGRRARVGPRRQLQPAGTQPDGVIPRYGALIATAQQFGEVARRAPPGGRALGGGVSEAAVEVSEELRQKGVGGFQRGDPPQAELADEAILQGPPQPLDAALGLR